MNALEEAGIVGHSETYYHFKCETFIPQVPSHLGVIAVARDT